MKTKMTYTSLMAYYGGIDGKWSKLEKEVLSVFIENPTITFTNAEIADELGLKDNSITGRTNTLRGVDKAGKYKDRPYLVIYDKRKCRISGSTSQAMALHPDTFRMFR